jgi:hypothetical protein
MRAGIAGIAGWGKLVQSKQRGKRIFHRGGNAGEYATRRHSQQPRAHLRTCAPQRVCEELPLAGCVELVVSSRPAALAGVADAQAGATKVSRGSFAEIRRSSRRADKPTSSRRAQSVTMVLCAREDAPPFPLWTRSACQASTAKRRVALPANLVDGRPALTIAS